MNTWRGDNTLVSFDAGPEYAYGLSFSVRRSKNFAINFLVFPTLVFPTLCRESRQMFSRVQNIP